MIAALDKLRHARMAILRWTAVRTWPVLRSNQWRLRGSVTIRSWTINYLFRATAGLEFVDEQGGGPGVRLRKRQLKKE